MHQVVVGSLNKTKVNAVHSIFSEATIVPTSVASDVSLQPVGDEETLKGAMNRAKNAQALYPNSIAIGLEGGVMHIADQLYLNNWGALMTRAGKIYTAAGARIRLPDSFIAQIEAGNELSDVMNAYTKKEGIRHHEGAIGIFTNHEVDRAAMFTHIVALLKGQMNYWDQ